MKEYLLLARLLEYPADDGLLASLPEAQKQLLGCRFSNRTLLGLTGFLNWLRHTDSIFVQESYVGMVDRGRQTSLNLFEHVHGESKERGSAMIDLQEFYLQHGMPMLDGELPDYLSVILEFASQVPAKEAKRFLGEIAHIVESIYHAHSRKGTPWAPVLAAVLEVADGKPESVDMVAGMTDLPEPTVDEAWEEPVVEFAGDCKSVEGEMK